MTGKHSGSLESNVWKDLRSWIGPFAIVCAAFIAWGALYTTSLDHERRIGELEPLMVEQGKLQVHVQHLTEELGKTNRLLQKVLDRID